MTEPIEETVPQVLKDFGWMARNAPTWRERKLARTLIDLWAAYCELREEKEPEGRWARKVSK